jgi:hypothetical protein
MSKLEFEVQLAEGLPAADTAAFKTGVAVQLQPQHDEPGGLVLVLWQGVQLGAAPAQHTHTLLRCAPRGIRRGGRGERHWAPACMLRCKLPSASRVRPGRRHHC